MGLSMLGRKVGMTQRFDGEGRAVPVTVLEMAPCPIVQKKTEKTDGYDAVQIGVGQRRKSRTNKALAGHFKKNGVEPTQQLREIRPSEKEIGETEAGGSISVSMFEAGEYIDVEGTSKGKGTAGVIKRWNFHGQKATHGAHENFRHGGAIGQCATPAKLMKGKKMAGRLGNVRVSTQNLLVIEIKEEQNLLFVRGAVPGARNGIVEVRKSVKKKKVIS